MPGEHSTHHLYSSHTFCKAGVNIPISQVRKLRLRKINCWKSDVLYILDWTVIHTPFCLVTKSANPPDLACPGHCVGHADVLSLDLALKEQTKCLRSH